MRLPVAISLRLLLNPSNAATDSGECFMASNMALKRAAKANRRKAVVAEKRKLDMLNDTTAARVLRAAGAPIRHCLVSTTLLEAGIGPVALARGISDNQLSLGVFLVDTWCLGVKDVYFRLVDADSFEMTVASMNVSTPMASVDPSYARKLLRDAAAWAASFGFTPHREFAAVERLFGDVNADACAATFEFGREGKPFYVPGPKESPAQIRLRFEQLRQALDIKKPAFAELDAGLHGVSF
jgi:hypothetical protein